MSSNSPEFFRRFGPVANAFERSTQDSSFERLNVNDDVGIFRHGSFPAHDLLLASACREVSRFSMINDKCQLRDDKWTYDRFVSDSLAGIYGSHLTREVFTANLPRHPEMKKARFHGPFHPTNQIAFCQNHLSEMS